MNVEAVSARTHIDGLTRYLQDWPYKPHRWSAHATHADQLFVDRITRLIAATPESSWTVSMDGGVAGIGLVEQLDWDTRILGMQAARLHLLARDQPGHREVAATLIERAVTHARGGRIRHLSVRVDAEDDPAIHGLEAAGFLNVDALMTFSGSPGSVLERAQPSPVQTRSGLLEEASVLGGIAADAFIHGRFHADPSIPRDTARELYRAWTAACCERAAADEVIVALDDDRIVGFVACRMLADTVGHPTLATGTIPLIASASPGRGRGAGSALIAAAAQWFSNRGAGTIEVGTQLRNVTAARLYERNGFRLAAGALSFRKMIEA